MREYMEEVTERKKPLHRLRTVTRPEEEEGLARARREEEKAQLMDRSVLQAALSRAQERVREALQRLEKVDKDIAKANTPPPFCRNPLPERNDLAYPIIFFFLMPKTLDLYSTRCMLAQQALAPRNPWHRNTSFDMNAFNRLLDDPSGQTWLNHFTSCNRDLHIEFTKSYCTFNRYLILSANHFRVPKENSFGPRAVDDIDEKSDGSVGMWFPNFSHKIHSCNGSNPFQVQFEYTASFYTEYLPQEFSDYQWMNAHPAESSTPSDRGNVTYARQDLIRRPFDALSFQALGSLRAFPYLQYRNVVSALRGQPSILPLSSPVVIALLRQAMYHVGELSDNNGDFSLVWHADYDGSACALATVLDTAATYLKDTPRAHESFVILSELACYLSQESQESSCTKGEGIKSSYLDVTLTWLEQCSKDSRDSSLYERMCLINAYSILSLAKGRLTGEEARQMVCQAVSFQKNLLFIQTRSAAVEKYVTIVQSVLSSRAEYLVNFVSRLQDSGDHSAFLNCVVSQVFDGSDEALQWTRVSSNSCCFEATDTQRVNHFAVNLLSGKVLLNGAPPDRLPSDVLLSEPYNQTFGNRDFEVRYTGGVYRTIKLVKQFFEYQFSRDKSEGAGIIIREVDSRFEGLELELMDKKALSACCADIPPRVLRMWSHWLCKSKGVIVSRGPSYGKRNPSYITVLNAGELKCYEIPKHRQHVHWFKLVEGELTSFDRLIRRQSINPVVNCLAKFESVEFIHALLTPGGQYVLSLPRFKLTFTSADLLGPFVSVEHKGYRLRSSQQFHNFLPFFSQYIILENNYEAIKILVPIGSFSEISVDYGPAKVRSSSSGSTSLHQREVSESVHNTSKRSNIFIDLSGDCGAECAYFSYQLNPRSSRFTCSSIKARLYLAAVYTVAGTLLPDDMLKMTGSEAAIELVRHCWVSRPLSVEETELIRVIQRFAYRDPFLESCCGELIKDSQRLSFLYNETHSRLDFQTTLYSDSYAVCCAISSTSSYPYNQLRRHDFEITNVGHQQPFVLWANPRANSSFDCTFDFDFEFVEGAEGMLKGFVCEGPLASKEEFPIRAPREFGNIGKEVVQQLLKSWDRHHERGKDDITQQRVVELELYVGTLWNNVTATQELVLESLITCVDFASTQSQQMCLMRSVNRAPALTFVDLLRFTVDDSVLLHFQPFLNPEDQERFRKSVLFYLELCVLEDKLRRIQSELKNSNRSFLVRELNAVRKFDVNVHPRWLVFEAEGGIQIRPEQYVIAKHMIDSPGKITQLNMGLGKTRVILPMLVLHFSEQRSSGPGVVRIHFLSSLIREAFGFLHQRLTASVFNIRLLEQPFTREIQLKPIYVKIMTEFVVQNAKRGCCQIVAPEHRNSLLLKSKEYSLTDPSLQELLEDAVKESKFVDIFDECDALLHYKYQLVYAVGNTAALEDLKARSLVFQSLFRVLNDGTNPVLESFLNNDNFAMKLDVKNKCEYRQIRFANASENAETQKFKLDFHKAVVEQLYTSNLPQEMQWIKASTLQGEILVAVTDKSKDCIRSDRFYETAHYRQILALRGALAHGLLGSFLKKRYRVDYGISVARKKRLAVPFTAADQPSLRAEFSQPDVGICLTTLSYYYCGLTREQFHETITMLLTLGHSAQRYFYGRWFDQIRHDIRESRTTSMLDDVIKIDLTNSTQQSKMFELYFKATEVINFWLNYCVFPTDTAQYTQNISATACHLVDDRSRGFSGTNDTQLLYPFQVEQNDPDEHSIVTANGHMLKTFLQYGRVYHSLHSNRPETGNAVHEPLYKTLLDTSVDLQLSALIDTGALLAGTSNASAALYIVEHPKFDREKFLGVTYFDPDYNDGSCWVVLNGATKEVKPLDNSPILAEDTFALFDDARTRGADLKLKIDAVAGLTLCLGITKDKLMQGAGRMRLLGLDQTVVLIGTKEIERSVMSSVESTLRQGSVNCTIHTEDILQWVAENTMRANVAGLGQCVANGLQHCSGTFEQPENWSLPSLYAPREVMESLFAYIQRKVKHGGYQCLQSHELLYKSIMKRLDDFGHDVSVIASGKDSECERELQLEEEREKIVQCEYPRQYAEVELNWNYSSVLGAISPTKLPTEVLPLQQGVLRLVSPTSELQSVDWSVGKVYGTINFFRTIQSKPQNNNLIHFARRAATLLSFNDGSVLLLSEKEADAILKRMLQLHGPSSVCLANIALIKNLAPSSPPTACKSLALNYTREFSNAAVTTVQLFNGETTFYNNESEVLSSRILLYRAARHVVEEWISSRGQMHNWAYSDLAQVCMTSW